MSVQVFNYKKPITNFTNLKDVEDIFKFERKKQNGQLFYLPFIENLGRRAMFIFKNNCITRFFWRCEIFDADTMQTNTLESDSSEAKKNLQEIKKFFKKINELFNIPGDALTLRALLLCLSASFFYQSNNASMLISQVVEKNDDWSISRHILVNILDRVFSIYDELKNEYDTAMKVEAGLRSYSDNKKISDYINFRTKLVGVRDFLIYIEPKIINTPYNNYHLTPIGFDATYSASVSGNGVYRKGGGIKKSHIKKSIKVNTKNKKSKNTKNKKSKKSKTKRLYYQ